MRPGGQPNMQQLMKQAQKMQQQMAAVQAELTEAEVTGTAGGGLVTVTVNGAGELQFIKIDPQVVDPDDIELASADGSDPGNWRPKMRCLESAAREWGCLDLLG